MNDDTIIIRPIAKHHQSFLLVIGVVLLATSVTLNGLYWHDYKFQLMLLLFVSLIVLFVAFLKVTEPSDSLTISRQSISFRHRYGKWHIPWKNVLRIAQPSIQTNFQYVDLPYIGIRTSSLKELAENITPRLANRLIHEQKELLVVAARYNHIKLENGLIHFEPYELEGTIYKGPIAAWLYRTEQLSTIYGFHLYLPENSLDRSIESLVALLMNCKQHSVQEKS